MRANKKFRALAATSIIAAGLLVPSAAFAQVSSASGAGNVNPPEVLGVQITPPAPAVAVVDDTAVLGATVDGLAYTGGDILAGAALGSGALVIGAALLVARHRRTAA